MKAVEVRQRSGFNCFFIAHLLVYHKSQTYAGREKNMT